MSFEDFFKYFDKLEICHLGPDSARKGGSQANNWEGRTEKGAWIRGSSAGGCRNFLNTFAMNPQFRYRLLIIFDVTTSQTPKGSSLFTHNCVGKIIYP